MNQDTSKDNHVRYQPRHFPTILKNYHRVPNLALGNIRSRGMFQMTKAESVINSIIPISTRYIPMYL